MEILNEDSLIDGKFSTVEKIPAGNVFGIFVKEGKSTVVYYYLKTKNEGVGYHCVNLETWVIEELDGNTPAKDEGKADWC